MTCIVATRTKTGVLMGGDSCGGRGHQAGTVAYPKKVMRVGEFLIGYTSSFRMGQLLHFALTTKLFNEKEDLFKHLISELIPNIRRVFKDGGYLETNKDGGEAGGEFLLAHGKRLFRVHSDFGVLEYEEPYIACGCGEEYALGALYALKDQRSIGDRQRLTLALGAASRHSGFVRGPYVFESTDHAPPKRRS